MHACASKATMHMKEACTYKAWQDSCKNGFDNLILRRCRVCFELIPFQLHAIEFRMRSCKAETILNVISAANSELVDACYKTDDHDTQNCKALFMRLVEGHQVRQPFTVQPSQ